MSTHEIFRAFMRKIEDVAYEKVKLELQFSDRELTEREETILRAAIGMGAAEVVIQLRREHQEKGKR